MLWVLEIVILLVFVGFGGFEGFIAWSVLTALIMFGRHSANQNRLKAAELLMKEEHNRKAEEAARVKAELPAAKPSPPEDPLREMNLVTMMWGAALMVRRVSATQWEMKYDADYRSKRMAELKKQLAQPANGPIHETCSECGTGGVLQGLHDATCSRFEENSKRREEEFLRDLAQGELEKLSPEPAWKPFPEKLVAPLETRYQRHLLGS